MQPVLSLLALHLLQTFLISELTFVRLVLPLAMIHDLIMPFPEDSQGGKASYVVIPAQVHLTSAVNLHSQHHMGAGQGTRGRAQIGAAACISYPDLVCMQGICW